MISADNGMIKDLISYVNTLSKKIFSAQLSFKNENGYVFPRWDSKEVGEIFKITRGNVLAMNLLSNERNKEKPFPVYSSQTKNKGLAGYHSDFLFENAITWTTDGANAGDVNYRIGKFYCTNVCGVLLSKDGYANVCISELINSVSKKYVSYVGNPKLMNGIMAKIKIPFPSLEEQHKIADFLLSIDGKIEIETSILQQLERQKTYFLANLFI
ncbi:restriction endonuclease subunit S [Empedobacter tilapiae]|uniref:restriction endonuclease subunit S n=1 Tax=Empedobacter tilapiae TaxID=2491114 RepID=UPI0028D64C9B|nr:restriction endonuclease subunit S [Empedobacter tilapiae]